VEPNERARDLCATNAQRHAPGRIRTVGPDGGPDRPIDVLWSNPPVRIGKARLYPMIESWLDRLAPTGVAVLVMGKNLGADSLHRHLTRRGHPARRLGSKAGYRVFAVGPRPG
jgi:16S rRNA G1207 methylase RsmC